MKQLLKDVFIAAVLVFAMASCYDDYKTDYIYTSTYFSMQSPTRTVIEDESMSIEVGAMLSGRYENTANETVNFEIDPTMLLDTAVGLTLLPTTHYEISNNSQIEIKSGDKLGVVTVTFTEAFLNDPNAHKVHYALPLRITDTSLDSILPEMDSTIIAVKYQNKYYGAYRVQGIDTKTDATSGDVTANVYSDPDLHQNAYAVSGTLSRDTLTLPYLGQDVSGSYSMKLAVAANGAVAISSNTAGVDVLGTGTYDETAKKFYLSYSFDDANGNAHQVKDTLIHFAYPMSLETWR